MKLFNPNSSKEEKMFISIGIICAVSLLLWLAYKTIYNDFPHQDKVNYNCVDFPTQREAQLYFKSQGGSVDKNVDYLDDNHNGVACEDFDYR